MVNSFIHVLMYSYYGLAAMGPNVARYLWWKKYLTILQLVSDADPSRRYGYGCVSAAKSVAYTSGALLQIQFTTALILGINSIRSGCDFPMWMQYALVIYMISFIVLFGNFYAKSYIERVSSVSQF